MFLKRLLAGIALCLLPLSAFAQGTNWEFLIYYPDTGLYSDQLGYTNNPASNVTTNDFRPLSFGDVNASNVTVSGTLNAGTNLMVNGTNMYTLVNQSSAWEIGIYGWLLPRNSFMYDPQWTTNAFDWLVPKN